MLHRRIPLSVSRVVDNCLHTSDFIYALGVESQSLESQLFDVSAFVAGDWCDVAERLGMSVYETKMIEIEIHTKRERAYLMLCRWHSKEGDNASVDKVKAELKYVQEHKKPKAVDGNDVTQSYLFEKIKFTFYSCRNSFA